MDNMPVRRFSRLLRAGRLFLLLILILIPMLTLPVFVQADVPAPNVSHLHDDIVNLRVGFFAFDGYHQIDEDGTRSGFGYDLLQLMARYAQLEYTYVGYDKSIDECEQMLERGEIDLLSAIKWNSNRAKKFDFSSRSIGNASTQIFIKAGNTEIIAGDYSTYAGKTFGVLRGTTHGKELAEFARKHDFDYKTIYYDSTQEMANALQAGEIDLLISTSLRTHHNEWIIESFNEAPIFFVVRKGDQKTLDLINLALDRMELEEHHWHTELPKRYFESSHSKDLYLTESERKYLAKQKEDGRVFRVLVNPERYPYSYVEDGQMAGIMIDLFALVAERAGIDYEWIICSDREDYAQRMYNEQTDICIDMSPDFYFAENLGYIITDTYLTAPFSWIRRNDSSGDIKLAAKLTHMQFAPAQYVYNNAYHEIDYIEYATAEECIQSVKDGVTDGYLAYTYQAEQIILHDMSNSLMASISQAENKFAIGTTHDINRNLDSILNKAVFSLSESEITDITRRHTSFLPPTYSFLTLLQQNASVRFATAALLMIIGLLVIIAVQQRLLQSRMKNTIYVQKRRLNQTMEDMLGLLASAIEFRSSESGDHVNRISSITRDVITALSKMYPDMYHFAPHEIHQMATAAVLHDVGKIAIPDYVLNKPGKLTSLEFKLMQQHPIKGCELLERIPKMQGDPLYKYAHDICRWHHERWDGKGYPDGLKGDEIPIWAQAASIADVFDALISPRVYKQAYSTQEAIHMICNGQCGQFNPRVIEAFLSVANRVKTPAPEEAPAYTPAPASRDTTSLMLSAFQHLISDSTDIVFLKDVDLIYRAASPSFAEHVGKASPEDVICHTDAELYEDANVARRHEAEDRELLASGKNLIDSLEPLDVRDGMQRYGSTSKFLLTDSQGRIMGLLGITKDVTSDYFARKHHHNTMTTLFNLPPNAYYSAYLDLTSWKIVGDRNQTVNGRSLSPHSTMDELASTACESIRDERSAAYLFFKDFNLETLTALYESGKHKLILENLSVMPDQSERWLQNEVVFLIDPSNGHLCMTFMVLDIHEQKEAELNTIELAAHDPLTGLLNRSSAYQLAGQTLSDERFSESMHALFMIDLDDFKRINDTWGHRAGDECLILFAKTLQKTFRASDLIGRLGGDEFIVLMRFVARREIVEMKAATLIQALNQTPVSYEGVQLNASVGIALFPTDGTDPDQLYERADKAMYHAKHLGKNQFFFAGDL